MFWTRTMPRVENDTHRSIMDIFGRMSRQGFRPAVGARAPACNIWADENGAVLTSEIPGVELEDIEITVSGRDVTIKGARKEESADNTTHVRRERVQGEFERAFQLPFRIDPASVAATLIHGVLEITLPRAEDDKPRRVEVSAG